MQRGRDEGEETEAEGDGGEEGWWRGGIGGEMEGRGGGMVERRNAGKEGGKEGRKDRGEEVVAGSRVRLRLICNVTQ